MEYNFSTYLDFPVINLGCSGDTSSTSLKRFDEDVLRFQPLNLIILTGSNSLRAEHISAEDVINDLKEIRRKCEEHDIRPVFLTLMPLNPKNIEAAFRTPTDPDWEEKMEEINRFIRKQEYYVDIEPYFFDPRHSGMDYRLSVDGLHPDLKGKMIIAEAINKNKDMLR